MNDPPRSPLIHPVVLAGRRVGRREEVVVKPLTAQKVAATLRKAGFSASRPSGWIVTEGYCARAYGDGTVLVSYNGPHVWNGYDEKKMAAAQRIEQEATAKIRQTLEAAGFGVEMRSGTMFDGALRVWNKDGDDGPR